MFFGRSYGLTILYRDYWQPNPKPFEEKSFCLYSCQNLQAGCHPAYCSPTGPTDLTAAPTVPFPTALSRLYGGRQGHDCWKTDTIVQNPILCRSATNLSENSIGKIFKALYFFYLDVSFLIDVYDQDTLITDFKQFLTVVKFARKG